MGADVRNKNNKNNDSDNINNKRQHRLQRQQQNVRIKVEKMHRKFENLPGNTDGTVLSHYHLIINGHLIDCDMSNPTNFTNMLEQPCHLENLFPNWRAIVFYINSHSFQLWAISFKTAHSKLRMIVV